MLHGGDYYLVNKEAHSNKYAMPVLKDTFDGFG